MSDNKTKRVRLHDVVVSLASLAEAGETEALQRATKKKLRGAVPSDLVLVRRALDTRKRPPSYVCTVDAQLPEKLAERLTSKGVAAEATPTKDWRFVLRKLPKGPRPVVVGAGPAGLFAAYTLAQAGWPPILIERGKGVEERSRDVSRLYAHGVLNEDSNVCYGEGGAGTFSDGKLYTRVGDPRVTRLLRLLVDHGAKPSILIDHRPHLGTDKLVKLLRTLRKHLLAMGTTVRFNTAVEDFLVDNQTLHGLQLRGEGRLDASHLVLATGHSAREIWHKLHANGVRLEARPFAVGFRVEHPQAMINELRYGQNYEQYALPAADYRLTHNVKGEQQRGVYSFCMCPGGVVVTTPTHAEELCINGMSHASRSGRFANSALVVTVSPADFAAMGYDGIFAGVEFQIATEQQAYRAGGGDFRAPASLLADFCAAKVSAEVGSTSYRRGLNPTDLHTLYPAPVIDALKEGLEVFHRRMRGFITNEAKLIGVETRTASPVRVHRDDTLQAFGAAGLYPAGEGMGYGGGIVSAAVDGVRAAEALLESVGAERESI